MKIKILKPSLSAAKNVDGKIVLQDKSLLLESKHPLRRWGDIGISDVVGDNELFFYRITYHTDSRHPNKCLQEKGIGKLDSAGVLKREKLVYWTSFDGRENKSPEDFADFPADKVISVANYTPTLETCRNLFSTSVVTGNCLLVLKENEYIYCDKDGEMQTGGSTSIQEMLNSSGKPTELKQGINLATSSRPKKPKTGTLIFNKRSKKLEFYDGTKWKEIGQ